MVTSRRRVVVTGLGVVSPLGSVVTDFWQSLCAGRSGLSLLPFLFPLPAPLSLGGQAHDFDALDFLTFDRAVGMSRCAQMLVAAGLMAVRDAGLQQKVPVDTAVCVGSAFSTQKEALAAHCALVKAQDRPVVSGLDTDLSTHLARALEVQGLCETHIQGCTASMSAIGHGYDWIVDGHADVVVGGGTEAPFYPELVRGLASGGWLADDAQGTIRNIPRPFDQARCGLVMSEGAGCVVLEEYSHARRRGATIYAEIEGRGSTMSAETIPGVVGKEGEQAIAKALRSAGWAGTDVQYVHLTGLGLVTSDMLEAQAVKQVFGDHASQIVIGAVTGGLGHTFGASGVFAVITTALVLQHQFVPPIVNLTSLDQGCALDFVNGVGRACRIHKSVIHNSGFGGSHVALALSREASSDMAGDATRG